MLEKYLVKQWHKKSTEKMSCLLTIFSLQLYYSKTSLSSSGTFNLSPCLNCQSHENILFIFPLLSDGEYPPDVLMWLL